MTHSLRTYAPRLLLASVALSVLAIAGGCTEDSDPVVPDDQDTPNTKPDSGRKPTTDAEVPSNTTDAGTDAKKDEDACADGGCEPTKQGCALFPEAAFCDDFDNPEALTPGKTKWDHIEPS